MCDGARQHRCWNGISLDALLACDKVLATLFNALMELQGFDDTLVAKLQEEYAQLDVERIRTVRELEQKLAQVQKGKSNIVATIREGGGNRTLVSELTRLENSESELELKLNAVRSEKRPDLDLPTIEELRIVARASVADLPHDSAEFARHMRRLISPIYVFPYRLHDGGHIVLRAEMTLSLVSFLKPHLQECTAAGTPLSQSLVVDTFESPQRETFRNDIVRMTATTDLKEREIADRLGITQPVVQRAKKLQCLLNQLGQSDPYAPITEPPDDYIKLRRHLHKRYRFEPLDGFPRPCRSDSDRVAELASRHATQQAELSRETVKLQKEIVEGTQKLVEADAQARRDFLELEGKLDEQRGEVGRRHDELESERREIAKQRYRDPIVANALIAAATLLACLLPMLLAGWLLRSQLNDTDEHTATEILLDEITARHPALASPSRLAMNQESNSSAPKPADETRRQPPNDSEPSTVSSRSMDVFSVGYRAGAEDDVRVRQHVRHRSALGGQSGQGDLRRRDSLRLGADKHASLSRIG